MKNLITRTISGLIFVFIIIEGTIWTDWSFYGLWTLIGLLCLVEYNKLIGRTIQLKAKTGYHILGSLYIIVPIVMLLTIDPRMVITLLTIVWANDTGAYVVGVSIGKHKMAPKISPKKSWEGFFGGIVFAIGVSLVWYALYWSDPQRSIAPLFENTTVEKLNWVLFGAVIALAAVAGDLIESKLKRRIDVKDSGNLIPGHGGMLDRFDATLMAIPVAWLMLKCVLEIGSFVLKY